MTPLLELKVKKVLTVVKGFPLRSSLLRARVKLDQDRTRYRMYWEDLLYFRV